MIKGEDIGPDEEQWSLPIKFIVRQKDYKVGIKPRIINIFVS